MLDRELLQAEKTHFWQHGYVVVRGMFTRDEMAILKRRIGTIPAMNARVEHLKTQQSLGEHPSFETIFVWNDVLADDLFSKVGRSYKILDRLSFYYDDDVYDYHNKISLKYPGIVGFRPHQDFAYWKNYGCRFPEAHAVYIAIDDATVQNGCLRIVPDSHLLGLQPHGVWSGKGSDNGVTPEAMQALLAGGYTFDPIETAAGDVILFHGHTIHGSDDNFTDTPRLAMIATMNTRRNSPDPRLNRPGHPYWSHQPRVMEPITEADLMLPLPDFYKRFQTETPAAQLHHERVADAQAAPQG